MTIYEMTSTPEKRLSLDRLNDQDKIKLIMKLTDSSTFIEILYYIEAAENDRRFCQSYR